MPLLAGCLVQYLIYTEKILSDCAMAADTVPGNVIFLKIIGYGLESTENGAYGEIKNVWIFFSYLASHKSRNINDLRQTSRRQ